MDLLAGLFANPKHRQITLLSTDGIGKSCFALPAAYDQEGIW